MRQNGHDEGQNCRKSSLPYPIYELIVGDKLVSVGQKHLDKPVQALAHLPATMVPDDERHLELRMRFEVVELPGMEIGDKVAVLPEHSARHPVVEALGQVVQ